MISIQPVFFHSEVRAPARELNFWDFKVQCPFMESNFWLLEFEPRRCRRSFGVKICGSKLEKLGFHLTSWQYATFGRLNDLLPRADFYNNGFTLLLDI